MLTLLKALDELNSQSESELTPINGKADIKTERLCSMFNKLKRWFDGKVKRAVALLATAILLCGFTGCDSKESNSTPIAESKDSQNSKANPSDTGLSDAQNEQSGGQAEFNFDEAVKNITLFGHNISLPCRWSDLSNDFTHDTMYITSGNNLMCRLMYKGEKIGSIVFGGCDVEHSDEAESKPVVSIIIGFNDYGYPYEDYELPYLNGIGCHLGLLELNFGDLSMTSTEEDIRATLGEPNAIEKGAVNRHYLDYDFDNGYLYFCINDDASRKGRIIEFYIYVDSNLL